MKNRTSIAFAFAVALLAGAVAPKATFAAGGKLAAEGGKGPAVRMIDAINNATQADPVKLDDEQKGKVKEVIDDATAQAQSIQADMKANRAAAKGDKTDRKTARESLTELMTTTKQRVEAILTDDQKTAFRAALADERAKFKAEREQNRGERGDKKGPTTKPAAA